MKSYLLAIDQGTTSSRAAIFNDRGDLVSDHQLEFQQYFPHEGWVEHDPEEIWKTVLVCCKTAIDHSSVTVNQIGALGISNQRETTIVWNRKSGQPIYPAIVWQDRRTSKQCLEVSDQTRRMLTNKTGLLLDPYFSATKIAWILDHVSDARTMAMRGELAFGTIDTFLIWRFTEGRHHVTDATNASRTLLFNIHTQCWDEELLDYFKIPKSLLPEVLDSADNFGKTAQPIFGHEIEITGVAGDQQAAIIGQACIQPGMIKSTYGTGCFLVLNTGSQPLNSHNRLITTIAYRIHRQTTYALEGSIFIAGAAIQWLRDALHFFKKSGETEHLANQVTSTEGVYFVPAFTGLGAPYWDPLARAAILGLTRATQIEHIVRAALEAVCYQTRDLMEAIEQDYQQKIQVLRVDGGMVANNWLLQFLANVLNIKVDRPVYIESSLRGAAWLAGLGKGIYSSLTEVSNLWKKEHTFMPEENIRKTMQELYEGWLEAIASVRTK